MAFQPTDPNAMPTIENLQSMTPEARQRALQPMAGLLNLKNKRGDLEKQLARAEALRNSNMAAERTTAPGIALAGIGDIFNAGIGGYQQAKATQALEANTKAYEDPKYLEAMFALQQQINALRQPPAAAAPQPQQPENMGWMFTGG